MTHHGTADQPRPPLPLNYPAPGPRGRRAFAVGTFVSTGLVVLIVSALLIFVVPMFEASFRDFGVALPLATVLLLRAARIFAGGGWVVAPMIPLFFGFVAPLFDRYDDDPATGVRARRRGRTWFGLLLTLLVGLVVLFMAAALLLPMAQLITAVSGQDGS